MSDARLLDHCLELLAPLGVTRARRMFGGYGLYVDDLCIALVLRDTLYLKVDDTHRAAFEQAGCRPFTYTGKHGDSHRLSYYTAPDEAMESPAEMRPWARHALEAALAARARALSKKAVAKKAPAKKRAADEVVAKTAPATVPKRKAVADKASGKTLSATRPPAGKTAAPQALAGPADPRPTRPRKTSKP